MPAKDPKDDLRLDPRLRAMLGQMALASPADVEDRAELLARAGTEEARAASEGFKAFMEMCDNEEVAPSTGLEIETFEFGSSPDGNRIKIQLIRHAGQESLPCVYYIMVAVCRRSPASTEIIAHGVA